MTNKDKEGLKAIVLRSIKQIDSNISNKEICRVLMSLYIDLKGKRLVKPSIDIK